MAAGTLASIAKRELVALVAGRHVECIRKAVTAPAARWRRAGPTARLLAPPGSPTVGLGRSTNGSPRDVELQRQAEAARLGVHARRWIKYRKSTPRSSWRARSSDSAGLPKAPTHPATPGLGKTALFRTGL